VAHNANTVIKFITRAGGWLQGPPPDNAFRLAKHVTLANLFIFGLISKFYDVQKAPLYGTLLRALLFDAEIMLQIGM
jgi:hypothetical protein